MSPGLCPQSLGTGSLGHSDIPSFQTSLHRKAAETRHWDPGREGGGCLKVTQLVNSMLRSSIQAKWESPQWKYESILCQIKRNVGTSGRRAVLVNIQGHGWFIAYVGTEIKRAKAGIKLIHFGTCLLRLCLLLQSLLPGSILTFVFNFSQLRRYIALCKA